VLMDVQLSRSVVSLDWVEIYLDIAHNVLGEVWNRKGECGP
jgi:hypothetical protein